MDMHYFLFKWTLVVIVMRCHILFAKRRRPFVDASTGAVFEILGSLSFRASTLEIAIFM